MSLGWGKQCLGLMGGQEISLCRCHIHFIKKKNLKICGENVNYVYMITHNV